MKPEHLHQLIRDKRVWTEPLAPEDEAKGFKGWYASGQLPHFDAPGTRQFITYRLADAMPVERRHEWAAFAAIEDDLERRIKQEDYLDRGLGECHLRDPRIAALVQENLWHHDGVKYRLHAWVVMPNHVHVLLEIWQVPLGEVLHSLKSYTAKEALKIIRGGDGPSPRASGQKHGDKLSPPLAFWQDDYFDRYIRDEEHLRKVVRYMESNPVKAGLARTPEEWLWSSARHRGEPGLVVPVLTHPTAKRTPPLP